MCEEVEKPLLIIAGFFNQWKGLKMLQPQQYQAQIQVPTLQNHIVDFEIVRCFLT